jgi:hypothetical protein
LWRIAERILLPSMRIFLPNASLLLVMDDSVNDRAFVVNLTSIGALTSNVRVRYRDLVNITTPPSGAPATTRGYYSMQVQMFLAYEDTDSQFVGFLDGDALFTSGVSLGDVFDEHGRPRVFPYIGARNSDWQRVAGLTESALGLPCPVQCMTYFPHVVRTAHLRGLKAYVERLHNKSLAEVMWDSRLSQFGACPCAGSRCRPNAHSNPRSSAHAQM